MGVHSTVFLGPFIELHTKLVPYTRDTCNQPAICPKPSSGFCSQCGKPAEKRLEQSVTESPNVWQLEEKIHEALYRLGPSVDQKDRRIYRLGANEHRGCSRKFEWSHDEGRVCLVTPAMIEDELRWFKNAFAKELGTIRDLPFLWVEIHWGQVIYWS